MQARWNWTAVVVVAVGLTLTPGIAGTESDVPLKEVPEAVKRAAQQALPGLRLVAAEVEREGANVVYEIEGVRDGQRYEIELTASGEVLEIEHEDDEEIPVSKLPRRVRKAAAEALPGAKLIEAEIASDDEGPLYEIDARLDGKEYEILVCPDGRVVRVVPESQDADDDEEPARVTSRRDI